MVWGLQRNREGWRMAQKGEYKDSRLDGRERRKELEIRRVMGFKFR